MSLEQSSSSSSTTNAFNSQSTKNSSTASVQEQEQSTNNTNFNLAAASNSSLLLHSLKPGSIKLQPAKRVEPNPDLEWLTQKGQLVQDYLDSTNYYAKHSSRLRLLTSEIRQFFTLRATTWGRRRKPKLTSPIVSRPFSPYASQRFEPKDPLNYLLFDSKDEESSANGFGVTDIGVPLKMPFTGRRQSFTVFPLFTGIKTYLFGNNKKNRHIRFPPEIVEDAERVGDRAGKDREVRRAKVVRPKRLKRHRSKFDKKRKRKVVDPELGDDFTKSETCFEKIINRLIYGFDDNEDVTIARSKFSANYNKAVNLFATHIELAGEFVDGNLFTLSFAEKIFEFPKESSEVKGLNYVAGQLWMFAFGIHDLFEGDSSQIPTRSEFGKLISNFGILAEVTEALATKLFHYAEIHAVHSKEWLTTLKKMGTEKLFKLKPEPMSTKIPKPGKTLKIYEEKETKEKDAIPLCIMARGAMVVEVANKNPKTTADPSTSNSNPPTNNSSAPPTPVVVDTCSIQWTGFNSFSKEIRLNTLADLLDSISESVNRITTQARFFTDDMTNSKFEDEDLLFITRLYLLDDLLKYFARSKETTPENRKNLYHCMSHFAQDMQDLIRRGQAFIEKIAETNDMIQLCFDYMKAEYAVHLHTDITESFHAKRSTKSKFCFNCNSQRREFHYKPEQFLRTDFRDIFMVHPLILPNIELLLRPDNSKKESLSVRFAQSIMNVEGGGSKFAEERDWTIIGATKDGLPKIRRMSVASVGSVSLGTTLLPKSNVPESDYITDDTNQGQASQNVKKGAGGTSILKRIDIPEGTIEENLEQNTRQNSVFQHDIEKIENVVLRVPPPAAPVVEKSSSAPPTDAKTSAAQSEPAEQAKKEPEDKRPAPAPTSTAKAADSAKPTKESPTTPAPPPPQASTAKEKEKDKQ